MNKISLILTEFPPKYGGMQTHAIEMAKKLSNHYEIIIYTYKSIGFNTEAKEFDRSVPFQIRRILSRVSFFFNVQKLVKEIKSEKPSLIYSSTIYYGILSEYVDIPIICRSVGNDLLRPWIIYPFKIGNSLMNNHFVELVFHYLKKRIDKPPTIDLFLVKTRVKLAKRCAIGATVIIGNSEYTKNAFNKLNIHNCKVLSGGVNNKMFMKPINLDKSKLREHLNLTPNSYIIMTACRFVKKKGLDFLIESFTKLEQEFSDIELIIIGDGPLKSKLLKMNKSQKISFLGKKTFNELPNYYWASNLFVLCSREVKNEKTGYIDAETMGRVLCEANAASLPVLASNSGGISSIITNDENGLLYETDNFESFKKQFAILYGNKNTTNRLIKNGEIKSSSTYDWNILLAEHLKIFTNISSPSK